MLKRLQDFQVTEDIARHALELRNTVCRPENLGKEYPFESAGVQYAGVIERHYHPPGGQLKPWGPHCGVSVFRVIDEGLTQIVSAPGGFHLGAQSEARLKGVHPDLVRVVRRAIACTPLDFTVVEGVRTIERQRELVEKGASQNLKSRHLTGHAVDLAPWWGGQIHWDWPRIRQLSSVVLAAAAELGIAIEWGGNWTQFPDGPHYQLPWSKYL